MHGPAVVGWLLTALTGATGLYCLARLVRRRAPRAERALNASEALKGIGMAAMAVPYGVGWQPPVAMWVVLFGCAATWSLAAGLLPGQDGVGGTHRSHHIYHGVGHLAMAYMALAMAGRLAGALPGTSSAEVTAMSGMGGMGGAPGAVAVGTGPPSVTWLLLLFFGGYAVLAGLRLISAADTATGSTGGSAMGTTARGTPTKLRPQSVTTRVLTASELPHACRLVLGLGMVTMLLLL